MSDFNLFKFPECPEFIDEALSPPAKEIGKTVSNVFYSVFSIINYPSEKLRIKQSLNLEKYKEDIRNEISKIPEEKLIKPPLSTIGPALEDSKFFIEEEDLRKMFAKLIASSMNKDYQEIIHPSFTEIIKQLSPLDAIALKSLSKKMSHPIITYRLEETRHSSLGRIGAPIVKDLVMIDNIHEQKLKLIPSIINNLVRLHLVDTNYSTQIEDDSLYESTINFFDETVVPFINKEYLSHDSLKNRKINRIKGILELTSFGINFIETCII